MKQYLSTALQRTRAADPNPSMAPSSVTLLLSGLTTATVGIALAPTGPEHHLRIQLIIPELPRCVMHRAEPGVQR